MLSTHHVQCATPTSLVILVDCLRHPCQGLRRSRRHDEMPTEGAFEGGVTEGAFEGEGLAPQ
jgi:hypothetical protein